MIALTAFASLLPFTLGAAELTSEDVTGWAKSIAAEQGDYTGNPLESIPDQVKADPETNLTASPDRKVFQGRRTLIFVSRSMSDNELKSILLENADDTSVQLVVRGFPDGVNTAEAIAHLQKLVMETHSKAGLIIDPPAFKRHNITEVPVTILEESEVALLTAKGNSSAQYVADAYAQGQRGDLGVTGPMMDIAERDLVDVMQERAHQLDFEKLKKSAKDRFWANQKYFELDHAVESRTREIDPTVIVGQDILDPKGNVITAKGTRINPLDIRPFTQRLVVFDGRDKGQVKFAKQEFDDHSQTTRVTLILSALDTTDGWESFQQLQKELGAPLYLLTPEVLTAFEVEKVPSIVYSDRNKFIVQETMVERLTE
ncbi:TrbC family F-type conjugative pilus assembly protein [Pseudomonas frederiksbergensis]|uniref:TrbC family F-type conjugative pilus assembly protein n=1 Tax=Pseudomonas frederiksbergensis TaxID=104087 RepID=UPI001374763C|nr:TrbC family F-type conjugative pilus assembly protein [Pseudomonas frederiksbergensis]